MINSLLTVIYFTAAIASVYARRSDWVTVGWTSALHFFVLAGALLLARRFSNPTSEKLDAQGWTWATGKAILAFGIVSLCMLPLLAYPDTNGLSRALIYLFFGVTAYIEACALYLHDYLRPIDQTVIDDKVIDFEHRESLAVFASPTTAMMVAFGAVFGTYLINGLKDGVSALNVNLGTQLLLAFYTGVGFTLWILRPFQARAKEVRAVYSKWLKAGKPLPVAARSLD